MVKIDHKSGDRHAKLATSARGPRHPIGDENAITRCRLNGTPAAAENWRAPPATGASSLASPIIFSGTHPVIRKLDAVLQLSEDERKAILALPVDQRSIEANQEVVREGDHPTRSIVVLEGVACAFKLTGAGRRQILAFYITGDIPDLPGLHLKSSDISVATISACKLGFIQHADLWKLCERHVRVAAVLWRETLVQGSISREWITNVGQREGLSRAAHLICEFVVRMRVRGLASDYSCDIPMTQLDLGDALGLSAVHVNRVLQELRKLGLIKLGSGHLKVLDWDGLKEIGDFDPGYLHLRKAAGEGLAFADADDVGIDDPARGAQLRRSKTC
ncbi:MAG: Crp/Fnr family transcriptional regulator [Bradyrhizobium sp.]